MSEHEGAAVQAGLISESTTAHNSLSTDSYTTQRLQHASPEHLHMTTRRFFIGPIPEGWLNSHRKAWYKRRLALNNYSAQDATFEAAAEQRRRSTTIDLRHPSLAARAVVSFPQPTDVYSLPSTPGEVDTDQDAEEVEAESDGEIETRNIAPVSTREEVEIGSNEEVVNHEERPTPHLPADVSHVDGESYERPKMSQRPSQHAESWKTANENLSRAPTDTEHLINQDAQAHLTHGDNDFRQSTSIKTGHDSHLQPEDLNTSPDDLDSSSRTALLPDDSSVPAQTARQVVTSSISPELRPISRRNMTHENPAPMTSSGLSGKAGQKGGPGVRFKVTEGVADRGRRMKGRAGDAKQRVAHRISRRDTLKAGTVVKMEKMLVRVDVTMQQLPTDFDENESMKIETKPIEKWRELMVVARKSNKQDEDDFRLQYYQTRVIPQLDNEKSKKKPHREIKLLPSTTHVNLYSSLDKTVVIWHPYRKGTRIIIMKPVSAAHAVEWYTFLRTALGLQQTNHLQVNVPDLDVELHIGDPFQSLQVANFETDEAAFLASAAAAEQAVAGRIISQSMEMLKRDPEWADVLHRWSETANMGLAWKRYDRLEWVYGVNEKKMFGSIAMQQTHDLELRPKQHYPTQTYGRRGVLHEEPAPIEGFLIRLTSQKGLHKRFGKAFFKRLYFSTHDQFLFFSQPAQATPPHPPRLATITGTNIPSSQEIVQKTPLTFSVEPFRNEDGQIQWLKPTRNESALRNDMEAAQEHERVTSNLLDSDGHIDMTRIAKVRKIKWGATEVDEVLDSGSDVDFHAHVDDTVSEDGTTKELDDDRIFELVLHNGLVIRLQAYDKDTRRIWMTRLRTLVKYWKLRMSTDIQNLKAVRQANLDKLSIDEEMEAMMGQFARKWEVSRSDASPEIYNMCRLTACRTITMSGMLYRKARRHATFQRCNVLLAGGQLLIYQAAVRKTTGEQVSHIHSEKQESIDLHNCYVYSGLIVEDDLLYQNRTFDANQPGMLAPTPRVYLDDGWTAADIDVMTCFVVWMNRRKSWFRSVSSNIETNEQEQSTGRRSKLKRVAQLGVPGRGMVFKCRSRAERDLWVTSVAAEIEAAVGKELLRKAAAGDEDLGEARLEQ